MVAEFGWSRGSLSGAYAVYIAVYSLLGFVAGRLTDRWGPRAVVATGGVFLGAALTGMSLVSALWQPYVLYGLVAAAGMATAYVPCNATIVRWFVRRRGLAVGIATSGQSLGMLVMAPLAQVLVSAAGWRTAYVVFGLAALVCVNVAAPLMRRDPGTLGLQPDGDPAPAPGDVLPVVTAPFRDVLRTPALWMLTATFTLTWIPVFVPIVHAVSLARDRGYSALVGSALLSAIGAAAIAGRLGMGVVSDRTGRKPAVALALVLQTLAFVLFVVPGGILLLFAAAALFGFAYGAIGAMFPAIVGDFFGPARVGSIVGFIFAVAGITAGAGPLLAGAVFDATGTYALAFVGSAAVTVAAGAALALARRPS